MSTNSMLAYANDETAYRELTPLQEEYVVHVLDGKSETEIGQLLAVDRKILWEIKRNPLVASEVFGRAAAKLRHEVFPTAVSRLHKVLIDESESTRNVIAAAKTVLQYEQASEMMRSKLPSHLQKPIEEMNARERSNRIASIRAELREIQKAAAEDAKDITPNPD